MYIFHQGFYQIIRIAINDDCVCSFNPNDRRLTTKRRVMPRKYCSHSFQTLVCWQSLEKNILGYILGISYSDANMVAIKGGNSLDRRRNSNQVPKNL